MDKVLREGHEHHRAGRLTAAAVCYQQVIEKDPGDPRPHHLLGALKLQQGDYVAALHRFSTAVDLGDDSADLLCNLAHALLGSGEAEACARQCRSALEKHSGHAATHNVLGNALRELGDHRGAVTAYEAAIKHNPQLVQAHANLGVCLWDLGLKEGAMRCWVAALRIAPRLADLHYYLARGWAEVDRLVEAEASYRRCIALRSDFLSAHDGLGRCLLQQGKAKDASKHFEVGLDVDGRSAEAHRQLGIVQQSLGDREAAGAHFRAALSIEPNFSEVRYLAAFSVEATAIDTEIASLREQLAKEPISPIDAMYLHFALARLLEERKSWKEAFDELDNGHRLKRQLYPYDLTEISARVEALTSMPASTWESAGTDSSSLLIPVFVVGMPRSGTSLVEQILSAHSMVNSIGESRAMGRLISMAERRSGRSWPESMNLLEPEDFERLRQVYLAELTAGASTASYVVDKMPANYQHLGLVFRLFPDARVLYCERDPLDNCVSLYRHLFLDAHGYADDLSDLGQCYRQHTQLMKHWDKLFPRRIFHVVYEDLVAQPEDEIRTMLDFCGLEYQEGCSSFYTQSRVVHTASSYQVRQPINAESIGAWRRYENFLGPLIESLN